jgi:thiosulfate reductase cytochrome b subunit
VTVASFLALVISGMAILLAHPRLYWGETGAIGTSSLIDLPLPLMLTGQSGWGRSLHFLSAWVLVFTGATYLLGGMRSRHFSIYSVLQRRTYIAVVFVLVPLMIWTGLAMSPAITSVVPALVTVLGGQQSARTIHFVVGCLLVAFVVGHVVMVAAAGFVRHVAAMIVGGEVAG